MVYFICDADHTHPYSAEVKKELSYTSTHPVGPPGPVKGFPLPLPLPRTRSRPLPYLLFLNQYSLTLDPANVDNMVSSE
jgi:hypothetical protein